MNLEEAILEKVRHLPESKQEEVLRFVDELERSPAPRSVPYWDGKKEMEWLKNNSSQYVGLWVALDGDRLIAATHSGREAFAAADAQGVKRPLVHFIHPPDEHMSGWIERVD
jgi:hypothetical protein